MEQWSKEEIELYNSTQWRSVSKKEIWSELDFYLQENDLWIHLYTSNEVGKRKIDNGFTKLENYVATSLNQLNKLRFATGLEIIENIHPGKLITLKNTVRKIHERRLILESLVSKRVLNLADDINAAEYKFWFSLDIGLNPDFDKGKWSDYAKKVIKGIESSKSDNLSNPVSALFYWIEVELQRKPQLYTTSQAKKLHSNDWANWYTSIREHDGAGYGDKTITSKHIQELEEVLKDDSLAFDLLMKLQKKISSKD